MAIASPALYLPLDVVDVTDETVGAVVSIISALLPLSEFVARGEANINVALLPAASLIVPLLSAKAVGVLYPRSALV